MASESNRFRTLHYERKIKSKYLFLISIFQHIYNLLDRKLHYTHAKKSIVLHIDCIAIKRLCMLIVMTIIQSLTKNVLMMVFLL